MKDGSKNLSSMMATGTVEFDPDILLNEDDIIKFGNLEAHVIHTPGHTPGGISLKIENALFTGDTLFAGSIGRTDFEYGSFEDIMNSIKNKLLEFPEETRVYPGHGPATTLKWKTIKSIHKTIELKPSLGIYIPRRWFCEENLLRL